MLREHRLIDCEKLYLFADRRFVSETRYTNKQCQACVEKNYIDLYCDLDCVETLMLFLCSASDR